MRPVEETVATRVLPTIRAMVAKRLKESGLSEQLIARRLGLSQSAVSKYLRSQFRREKAVEEAPRFVALAEELAHGLGLGTMTSVGALGAMMEAVRKEEDRGVVCRLHEQDEPSLRGLGCDLCVRPAGSDLVANQQVLGDLRAGLRMLEETPAFAKLVPNVGSNLAYARAGAKTLLDVAAVPGRISVARGLLRVTAAPEFGASHHVAEVVLALGTRFPALRAAMNIRYDDTASKAAAALRWKAIEFEASYEGRAEGIAKSLRRAKGAPNALFHRGAFGIEPQLYIVGKDASDVARRAIALVAPPA